MGLSQASDPLGGGGKRDAPAGQEFDTYLTSSLARELQTLASHTIHHYALIAMAVRAFGVEVDANFGMAPSTLRYQEKRQTAAA